MGEKGTVQEIFYKKEHQVSSLSLYERKKERETLTPLRNFDSSRISNTALTITMLGSIHKHLKGKFRAVLEIFHNNNCKQE